MADVAARLRAQKAYSTDPEYLERLALKEEAREACASGKETKHAPIGRPWNERASALVR